MTPPLACTVRDCGLLLERHDRSYVCARRHAYDIARSGYVNLLQPTDRRSLDAGDTPEAISARARLLSTGVGRAVIEAVTQRVVTHRKPMDVIVDLGSGSGELLAAVRAHPRGADLTAVGIDISTAAAEHAARQHRGVTWVVANADRRLPLLDRSVDVCASIHGRRNPQESERVLAPAGRLIVAVPAPDDLVELRTHVQGRAIERDRTSAVEDEHAPLFTVVDRFEVREQHQLDAAALRDLLRGTYRGERKSVSERVEQLTQSPVTLASVVMILERTSTARTL